MLTKGLSKGTSLGTEKVRKENVFNFEVALYDRNVKEKKKQRNKLYENTKARCATEGRLGKGIMKPRV